MDATMTGLDISPIQEIIMTEQDDKPTTINLGKYADSDFVTKSELCRAFKCSARTIQRMVERFEVPPPMTLAGRKVWIVGKVRAWLTETADRKEAEALKEAKRLGAFQ